MLTLGKYIFPLTLTKGKLNGMDGQYEVSVKCKKNKKHVCGARKIVFFFCDRN